MSVVTRAPALPAVTDADFATRVLASDLPVLVDYWAVWCPACRMVSPVLAELAGEWAGRARIVALDLDTNPHTARDQRVLAAPTMILYVNGEAVVSVVGARSKHALRETFEPHLLRQVSNPSPARHVLPNGTT
jgi:thioredoxin 1